MAQENDSQIFAPTDLMVDLYGDTKRSTEFTTELFKVEFSNLPMRPNYHTVKQLIEKQAKLEPHKIRIGQNKAFITFKSAADRDQAIARLNNYSWKGKILKANIANPRDDFVAKQRHKINVCSEADQPELEVSGEDINDTVCPLWRMSYNDQIKYKEESMRSVLNMSPKILKMNKNLKNESPELYKWTQDNKQACCPFGGVIKSPVESGYRNKCEFNIKHDGSIGFKMGRYRNGSDSVHRPPDNCPIVNETTIKILDQFQTYLKSGNSLSGYDALTHEGHYRQLTVRCNLRAQYLVLVELHPQNLGGGEIESEIKKGVECLTHIESIISIYYNITSNGRVTDESLRLVYGEKYLNEELNVNPERPLKFRVGPTSFFQVNSRAAEILYRSIVEIAQLNSSTMVLDVGCGTGTISLSLARKVAHVIGIEIIQAAVEDAKENAKQNDIENATFYVGRAEDLIAESISILKAKQDYAKMDGEIVAIVDPPRVGFNNSFIKTLRASTIKKIIYIACDPISNTNLMSLCRPKSKAYSGSPFVPTRAMAFDLFPHTKCCELLLVYERLITIE